MHNVSLINHTLRHTHAGTQDVSIDLTAGVVVRIIDEEEREGVVTSARFNFVTC